MTGSPAPARRSPCRRTCAGALAALLGWTLACAKVPVVPPPVPVPPAFSANGAVPRMDRWWEELDDAELSRLIGAALVGSPDLAIVWDRLAQARAVARMEGAPLWPQLDFDNRVGTTWSDSFSGAASTLGRRADDIRLGLQLSWEIDLFGRLRDTRNAARYDADASELEVRAAAITLSGEVASRWYRFVEQRRQLALLDAQIETNEKVLRLVTMRFRTGLVGAADVLRQRQLVEQRRGERDLVVAQAQVSANALAVLLGQVPVDYALPATGALPVPGPLPELGLPVELLHRRPDVRRAYVDILASDRRLAAAKADRYPRLSLSAAPAFTSSELADVFDNWMAGLAASLVAPILDGGRRRAEVARTRAVVSERIHSYGQVILTSFREVEDALVQERQQRRLIASLNSQLTLAGQTLERLGDRYVKGATDYLDVLAALESQQVLERNLVTARRELLDFRITLHRALAGGFEQATRTLASLQDPTPAAAPASGGTAP